jgi:ubiquitin-protein ligase
MGEILILIHLTCWDFIQTNYLFIFVLVKSPIGQVIYTLKVHIPEEYPKVGPIVNFIGPKLVMGCIDETGRVSFD